MPTLSEQGTPLMATRITTRSEGIDRTKTNNITTSLNHRRSHVCGQGRRRAGRKVRHHLHQRGEKPRRSGEGRGVHIAAAGCFCAAIDVGAATRVPRAVLRIAHRCAAVAAIVDDVVVHHILAACV